MERRGIYGVGGKQYCIYVGRGSSCSGDRGVGGKEYMEKEEIGGLLWM